MNYHTQSLHVAARRQIRLFFFGAVIILLSGCAGSPGGPVRGYELRIRYAEVFDVERVKMPSTAPAGAVVGGFTGLILSRNKSTGRQVASGIGGAALGGLASKALEGDRLGYSYALRFADDSMSQFITEKSYLMQGDCVAVERGEHANIRRVSKSLCVRSPSASIDDAHIRSAEYCHEAKDQLLAASSAEEIEAASSKVTILCQ